MKTCNTRYTTILAATLLCAGATHTSLAAAPAARHTDDAPRMVIDYSDLNLGSREGVEALYKRLSRAANRVCVPLDGRSLRERMAYRECRETSLDRALRAVGHPGVLARHAEHGSRAARG